MKYENHYLISNLFINKTYKIQKSFNAYYNLTIKVITNLYQ